MKTPWSRRRFVGSALHGVVAAGGARAAGAVPTGEAPFPAPLRAVLRAAMDEIIPEGASMPSASQAGGLAYLEATSAENAAFAEELVKAVQSLRDACLLDFGRDFDRLEAEERIAALRRLEAREDASAWRVLRDSVYEAYYTRPEIWRQLGYEFYPPDRPGPRPPDFDESVLARVRTMPPLYREGG